MLFSEATFHHLPQRLLAILRQADHPVDVATLAEWAWQPVELVEGALGDLRRRGYVHGTPRQDEGPVRYTPNESLHDEIDQHLVRALKEHAAMGELYFAYGSNLNPERLEARGIEPRFVARAHASRYVTGFPRTMRDGTGVAGLIRAPEENAYGALYLFGDVDWESLDFYEDVPKSYYRSPIHVTIMIGATGRPLLPKLSVITYMANPGTPADPRADYVEHILKGARHWGLPEPLITFLSKVPTISPSRRAPNPKRKPGWQRALAAAGWDVPDLPVPRSAGGKKRRRRR